MNEKLTKRNQRFQETPDLESIKLDREANRIELRKNKRIKHILKKRAVLQSDPFQAQSSILFPIEQIPPDLSLKFPDLLNPSLSPSQRLLYLTTIIKSSPDISDLGQSLSLFKLISGTNKKLPYSVIFDESLIKAFHSILGSNMVSLQFPAVWVLINVFHNDSEAIENFVNQGIIDILANIIHTESCPDLIENSIWAVGNIVGEGVLYRNKVINKGIVKDLIDNCNNSDFGIRQMSYWVLSTVCAGKPRISLELSKEIMTVVADGLRLDHDEIIENSAYIASFLTENYNEIVSIVIQTEIMEEIFELLNKNNSKTLLPALKVLGNIASGTDRETNHLVKLGILNKIYHLLNSSNTDLKREVYFILSNILSGSDESIESVINSPCMPVIISTMTSPDPLLRKEAVIGICNSTYTKSYNIIMQLVKINVLNGLIRNLEDHDPGLISSAMTGIRNILRMLQQILSQDKWIDFLVSFLEAEGVQKLEDLLMHSNEKIVSEAQEILDEFFQIETVICPSIQPIQVFDI